MLVKRDFFEVIDQAKLEVVLLWGARQVGKTTLLDLRDLGDRFLLDDLQIRERAQKDPALLLERAKLPALIDEAQYAPAIFSEIKLRVDKERRKKIRERNQSKSKVMYYLTGSNRTLLDKGVKESLAGRAHLYNLFGLSVKEIIPYFPTLPLSEVLFKGGLPILYARPELSVVQYLNDYLLSFVEKDVARDAGGIEKIAPFHTTLRLLAARTAQFIHYNEIATQAGVDQKTVQAWTSLLQRNDVVYLLPSYSSNLSKRIVKMPKLFFLDTGLCARLQGHLSSEPLWNSPQIGALFETLVFSEILKTKNNFMKDWELFTWRTKEQNEIDFILKVGKEILFIESKLAIHGAKPFPLDNEAKKVFIPPYKKMVVTAGGDSTQTLDRETIAVPIQNLATYLLAHYG